MAVGDNGEASAVGAIVAVGMIVAGSGVGETAVSISGAQAASDRKRKQEMRITCLTNRCDCI
jgi:hypothetical protein